MDITQAEREAFLKEALKLNIDLSVEYAKESGNLDLFKLAICEKINQIRDKNINGGVEFKGKRFQSAEKDRNLLTSTIALYSVPFTLPQGFSWIAEDNTSLEVTLQDLTELAEKMAQLVAKATYEAREFKDLVLKADSIEKIEKLINDSKAN
ncbi:MAG: DUF4376 domain-containing protein [Helicobacteraceae bacterium]|nr:DUF4376 domain-containing protein [Helicobacteraceae bacterium]